LAFGDTLELARRFLTAGDLGALDNGVERLEVEQLHSGASTSRVLESTNNALIDGVLGREGTIGLDEVAVARKLVVVTVPVLSEHGVLTSGSDTSDNGLAPGDLLGPTASVTDRAMCKAVGIPSIKSMRILSRPRQ